MRNKRMFCLDVVDTDKFLDMPSSAQALYFHLGMRADDDGFVASPKRITSMVNCGNDDFKLLIAKGYLIPFESGVVVIKHWKQNNYVRNDRYNETKQKKELQMLECHDGIYEVNQNISFDGIPCGSQMVYQEATECHTQKKETVTEENNKKRNNYNVHFESFWEVYPRKREKVKAYKCYNARLKDGYSEEELLTAAIKYAEECKTRKTEERYIKLGATFLGPSTPFTDYLKKEGESIASEEHRGPAADFYEQYMS